MKVSFYATALLGMMGLQLAQAVSLQSHEFDFADYELAELDTKGSGEVDLEADTLADADCEENVGGVTIRLSTPECTAEEAKAEKKGDDVSVENQMLKSLGDLSGKSMDLQEALKLQFAKTNKLMSTTNVTVSGKIELKPVAATVEAASTPAPAPVETKASEEKK